MFVVLLTFAEIGLHTVIGYIQGLEKENNNLVNKVSNGRSAKSSWSSNDDETETVAESDEPEVVVSAPEPTPKIDIWKKRTVGDVFDSALQQYWERKAAREAGR